MSPTNRGEPKKRTSSGNVLTTTAEKKPTLSPTKVPKAAPSPTDNMKLEERQSECRTAECDSELYASSCDRLRQLLDQMLKVKLDLKKVPKATASKATQHEMTNLRVQFSLAFLNLKKLNRLDKIRTKRVRESTSNVMQKVDSFHLQLQNLRYEVLHLKKEVARCLQFRSKDQDMTLVPTDEFYAKAPKHITDKLKDVKNEHQERLARLEFENLQREEMHVEREMLDKSKKGYEKIIREKSTNLCSLKPQLAAILEKTKVVQEYLNMPLSDERDQQNVSKYLPPPLFVLFSEMRAYGLACDKNLTVRIKGEVEEAKSANAAERSPKLEETEDLEEDIQNGDEEVDEDEGRKGKKHEQLPAADDDSESKATTDSKADKLKELFVVHPLTVEALLKVDDQNFVELCFSCLTFLEVITVKVNLVFSKENKALITNRDVLGASMLLSHLLSDNDFGNTIPNPSTLYILKSKSGTNRLPPAKLDEHGAAYVWAQALGGLDFPGNVSEDDWFGKNIKADRTVCQTRIEKIICSIRERFKSRIALQQQIAVLEKAKSTQLVLPIPPDFQCELLPTPQNRIRAWSSVNWEQYVGLDVTGHLVNGGAVRSTDFFYRLQLNREPATLIALISIGSNYPYTPPVFCLNLHWNGEHNLHNSERTRALERHINTCYANLIGKERTTRGASSPVLLLQIRELMACLDVLLESWNHVHQMPKVDFPREKLFLQAVRGRTRAPPLRYQHQLQMFSQ